MNWTRRPLHPWRRTASSGVEHSWRSICRGPCGGPRPLESMRQPERPEKGSGGTWVLPTSKGHAFRRCQLRIAIASMYRKEVIDVGVPPLSTIQRSTESRYVCCPRLGPGCQSASIAGRLRCNRAVVRESWNRCEGESGGDYQAYPEHGSGAERSPEPSRSGSAQ